MEWITDFTGMPKTGEWFWLRYGIGRDYTELVRWRVVSGGWDTSNGVLYDAKWCIEWKPLEDTDPLPVGWQDGTHWITWDPNVPKLGLLRNTMPRLTKRLCDAFEEMDKESNAK